MPTKLADRAVLTQNELVAMDLLTIRASELSRCWICESSLRTAFLIEYFDAVVDEMVRYPEENGYSRLVN